MEVKKITEGMTAPQVAKVIDDNFTGLNNEKANKKETEETEAELDRRVLKCENSEYHLDMTPDNIGKYYSAGGVLSDSYYYRSKEINLNPYINKYIKFSLGYLAGKYEYCFIKKSDGSYIPLKNALVANYDRYCVFLVTKEYTTLEASWDTSNNKGAFISVLDSFVTQAQQDKINQGVSDYLNFECVINAKISEKFILDSTNKYLLNEEKAGYNTGVSDFSSDSNWRTTSINMKQMDIIKIRLNTVPKTVIAVKVFDVNEKEVYRNSFDELFTSAGSQKTIDFVFFAKKKYRVELSYFKDTLKIYSLSDKGLIQCDIVDNTITEFSVDLTSSVYIGKYYSSGGNLYEDERYEAKEIDVTPNMINKVLLGRIGSAGGLGKHCFVKLEDERFGSLENYIIETKEGYFKFSLPSNAKKLQVSWDKSSLKGYWFIKSSLNYSDYEEIRNVIDKYEGKNTDLLMGAEWVLGKYYSAGGMLSSHSNYSATTIDVGEYAGKKIFVSMGYGKLSEPVGYMQYCFVKTSDGNYYYLNSFPWELATSGYIVTLPKNAVLLEVSYDRISKEPKIPKVELIEEGEISKLIKRLEKVESIGSDSLVDKKIFLLGDSISSTDYTWYKDSLKKYSGAEAVYNQGASGRNAAYQASNEYFNRLTNKPSDVVVALVGGNDSGEAGSIGTFSEQSELFEMGESVVSETNISEDYSGSKFIQAISHIIRKWKNEFYDFRLKANLSAKIVSSNNTSDSLFVGTEKECLEYARLQGWELGYGKNYFMICTETEESKREKLLAVKMPKLYFCTTLPQKRYNDSNAFSKPENWERKRLAVIECCNKYGIPCIDLAKEFAIDWSLEPFWPGQGYSGTSKTDNQGIYTMDGLHPNEFGYDWIARIVAKNIK